MTFILQKTFAIFPSIKFSNLHIVLVLGGRNTKVCQEYAFRFLFSQDFDPQSCEDNPAQSSRYPQASFTLHACVEMLRRRLRRSGHNVRRTQWVTRGFVTLGDAWSFCWADVTLSTIGFNVKF